MELRDRRFRNITEEVRMQTVRAPVLFAVGNEPKHEQASSMGVVSGAFVDGIDGVVVRIDAWVASHGGESDDLIDDCIAEL